MKCPHCRLINPESAERCDCGYDFRTGTQGQPPRSAPALGRVDLSAVAVLEQRVLAELLQKRFPDCLISDLDEPKGIILGSPLRRCRWGLFLRRKLLRGVCVSHLQEITFVGKAIGAPYLEVSGDSAFKGLPHGLFGLSRLMIAAGEGEDAVLRDEVRSYLTSDLFADLHARDVAGLTRRGA